ncbi:putative signal peptidase complex subunit 2 [Tetrabaena socialis]|uniref:Signal peptidase complex subunit 2 n=1 Tax=Tetrabaena socialis TaxID=47790 RepID=A0A2J8AJV9_9CHLO|nr:putative signal peptidase complex subunit 2 [Tetrabaena socialis]|eukprot:PNH12812.1 putative signal peptidase complex subunit 2 [Tetrabaena socialis]
MGRAKVPKVKGTASAAAPEEKEDREPVRVKNLYEAGALKGALDDVAREVVLDAGYEEDVFITNTKIILGVAAISAALYAQFGPGKFPSTWWTVFGCVVAYLILTLAMNLFTSKMEGDAFLVTRPFRGCKGLRVCSRLPRYSDQYSLALVDRSDPSL